MNTATQGFHLTHRHIVHPTDFTPSSQGAFHHALKLALLTQAHFSLLHIDPAETATGFDDFPRVRPVLERWGLLPPGTPKERVQELGLYVRKIRAAASKPAQAIVQHVTTHPADLIVLAFHRRDGMSRWFHRPVAEPVVRDVSTPVLFVPEDCEGFVADADGRIRLRSILLPAARTDSTQVAAETIAKLGTLLECDQLDIHVMHVDNTHHTPAFHPVDRPGWNWQATRLGGEVVPSILGTAAEVHADLIVMATEGHQSWSDALLGSTTEQVLRQAQCPLLALPIH